LFVLFAAVLACNFPGREDVREGNGLPTTAPTAAPSISPEEYGNSISTPDAPGTGYPLGFQASGNKTSYAASVHGSCQAQGAMRLTVYGDGAAELVATGPGFVDHINCTASSSIETWIIEGKVDQASQTVTFESCNGGGFHASGRMDFGSGSPVGTVTCSNKKGEKAVMLVIGQ
jgi:hypothetical protein